MKTKFYAFVTPEAVGLFTDWNSIDPIVTGVQGAQHKSFPTQKEAEEYILSRLSNADKRDYSLDRNRLYINKKFVRLSQYITEKESAAVQNSGDKKGSKYYAVITPRKVGVFDQWFMAKRLIDSTSKSKYMTFGTLGEARGFISSKLSEDDYEDFGLYQCELYVNKIFVRKKAYTPRKP